MDCIGRSSSDVTSLDYLVGPTKNIAEEERKYYDLSSLCTLDYCPGTQETILFTELHPLPPPLEQMTYRKWKAGVSLGHHWSRWRKKKLIHIQPVGEFPEFINKFKYKTSGNQKSGFIEMLRDIAEIFFSGFAVRILPPVYLDTNGWTVKKRVHDLTGEEQLLVTDMHKCLGKSLSKSACCILGISWTDLYPSEDLNFVLGEASPNFKCAMFSFGRFQPKLYREGNPPSPLNSLDGDIMWKMIKVICHETCHVFYMSHCCFFKCLMNESQSVQEALEQPLFLCPICMRKLQKVCGFELKMRYLQLFEMIHSLNEDHPSQKLQDSLMWLEKCIHGL